jgi:hypothetical protein
LKNLVVKGNAATMMKPPHLLQWPNSTAAIFAMMILGWQTEILYHLITPKWLIIINPWLKDLREL